MSARFRATCDCGWAGGPYRSERQAGHQLRRHSCEKQRVEAARAARVAARKAADGPRRDCQCKVARHEHGTANAYVVDKCRCRPCRDANARRRERQNKNRAYGRVPLVDAGPARDHALALMEQGMGLKRIVAVSDVSQGAMWKLLYGKRRPDGTQAPSRRITPKTEQRVLAVTLDHADGAVVDGTGTKRRIQALHTLGWGVSAIARQTGLDPQRLAGALHGRRVRAETHRAVADAYERLWDTPAPRGTKSERVSAGKAKARATKFGWAAPMAWDEGAIDDPEAMPFGDDLNSARGRRAGAVNADALTDCAIGWGLTMSQAADRLGVTKSAIEKGVTSHAPNLRGDFARNLVAQKYREARTA